jgi:PhoPQ-activated pathogenicity-related protein
MNLNQCCLSFTSDNVFFYYQELPELRKARLFLNGCQNEIDACSSYGSLCDFVSHRQIYRSMVKGVSSDGQ